MVAAEKRKKKKLESFRWWLLRKEKKNLESFRWVALGKNLRRAQREERAQNEEREKIS